MLFWKCLSRVAQGTYCNRMSLPNFWRGWLVLPILTLSGRWCWCADLGRMMRISVLSSFSFSMLVFIQERKQISSIRKRTDERTNDRHSCGMQY